MKKKTKFQTKRYKVQVIDNNFTISSLVLSEYIFTLSKLKVIDNCAKIIEFYQQFVKFQMKKDDVIKAI